MERTRERRRRRGIRALAAATGVLVAAATAIVAVAPAQAAACQAVRYTIVSSWNGGYQANISITAGSEALNGWTMQFDLPQGVAISSSWNATLSQSGSTVSARDVGWNGSIAAGASREVFGAVLSGSSATVPTTFRVNGEVCGGGTTTPSPGPTTPSPGPTTPSPGPTTPSPGPTTPVPTPTSTATPPPSAPTPGTSLPPAGARTSMAYDLIVRADDKGYTPKSGECSKAVHAEYWTYGPDGKVYPTWHPTRDSSGCYFGHEHGDDPRNAAVFTRSGVGWPAFGVTSEALMESTSSGSHRHEDHVGHKVVAVSNLAVVQGDNGNFTAPGGTTIATCDVLLKFHQGTHSPDAFTNNVHELILNQDCRRSNGQTFEVRYTALIPSGRPGGFGGTDCPGPIGQGFTNVGPAVPADSPSDTTSLGRLITGPACAQAIRDRVLRYDPISGGQVPLDSYQLHEFWFANASVSGAGVSFSMSPLFYVLNPGRYYDPSKPNNLGRQVELCSDTRIGGGLCQQVRSQGGNIPWDDPRSPFTGTFREYRVGSLSLTTSGPTTIYTDAYGRNPSTSPFAGSIKQFFSGSTGSSMYIRGASKDWAAQGVHLPN
ncbi:cellulose-binding domain-containing protein [Antribacter gilvus]|uniref:cellulose-binding domain-containing protein n=1 Tax=Antribacter gilvus TaxID=2304675 RepID=UPI001F0CAC6D|nr:cellulose-binding domain-containing protein [Antribacter gilvus]